MIVRPSGVLQKVVGPIYAKTFFSLFLKQHDAVRAALITRQTEPIMEEISNCKIQPCWPVKLNLSWTTGSIGSREFLQSLMGS